MEAVGTQVFGSPGCASTACGWSSPSPACGRAQEAGQVRDDLTPEDVLFLISAVGKSSPCHFEIPDLWRRYLGVILDGMRPDAATPLSPRRPRWTRWRRRSAPSSPARRPPRASDQALADGTTVAGGARYGMTSRKRRRPTTSTKVAMVRATAEKMPRAAVRPMASAVKPRATVGMVPA